MLKHDELERKALQLIVSAGKKGVLQSEMWRNLSASSRWGSRTALKLENKGLILRERELSKGRWTYRLYPKRLPATINSMLGCPCLTCPDDSLCGALSNLSPNECEKLTKWILGLIQKEANPGDHFDESMDQRTKARILPSKG